MAAKPSMGGGFFDRRDFSSGTGHNISKSFILSYIFINGTCLVFEEARIQVASVIWPSRPSERTCKVRNVAAATPVGRPTSKTQNRLLLLLL
jgi:hypothetical protein